MITRSKRFSSPPVRCACGSARVSSLLRCRRRGCRAAACSSWRSPRRRRCTPGRTERRLRGVAAVLLDVLLGQDQHAARARARVVDAHALAAARRAGPSSGRRRAGCRTRRPSCRPSRRTRRSGTRRRRRAGRGTRSPRCAAGTWLKCVDQLAQLLVRDRRLADLAGEVDVLDARRRAPGCASSSAARALLSPSPTLLVQVVAEVLPAGPLRHEERLRVEGRRARPAARPRPGRGPRASCSAMTCSPRRPRTGRRHRFRNSIPKMYSLNSEASILPRRMSAAANRCRSSCGKRQPRHVTPSPSPPVCVHHSGWNGEAVNTLRIVGRRADYQASGLKRHRAGSKGSGGQVRDIGQRRDVIDLACSTTIDY